MNNQLICGFALETGSIIEKARQQAQFIFQKDPELQLPEHALLAKRLEEFWQNGKGDIS
ncbi:hypothetical protein [uncultured Anaerolinea sp.]|uniref:hypothetical protein n=1 Tax=uncultured Anaerolinea sp. TaxID=430695 RepID=UPI00260AD158|nr:hypothetical protein [uncultured Anaerolinea sp.]